MKTPVRACCNRETFATEEEARRRLDRMTQLGLRSVLPIDVELCRNGWHLKFPREDSGPSPKVRSAVEGRDGNTCCLCGTPVARDDDSIHHRIPRGRGGSNTPDNLLLLCGSGTTGCHGHVESHRAEAYERGYLVRTGHEPMNEPVLLHDRTWVYLTPGGKRIPAEAASQPQLDPDHRVADSQPAASRRADLRRGFSCLSAQAEDLTRHGSPDNAPTRRQEEHPS